MDQLSSQERPAEKVSGEEELSIRLRELEGKTTALLGALEEELRQEDQGIRSMIILSSDEVDMLKKTTTRWPALKC